MWDVDSILKEYEEANDKSIDFYLLRFVIHEIEESSQWRKIIGFFKLNKDLLEALGLVWYVSQKTIDREIEYLGAKLLIFEAAIKIVAERNSETTISLRDKLANLSGNLESLVFEEDWGVNWNDVFRLPY
jgi:predicted NACHT family NTPase